jgi:hypothetical protein
MIPALGGGQTPARVVLAGKRLAAIFAADDGHGNRDRDDRGAHTRKNREADQPRNPSASN